MVFETSQQEPLALVLNVIINVLLLIEKPFEEIDFNFQSNEKNTLNLTKNNVW